jgi:drug/metabolite transporter (DMT)-like permease
MALIAGCLLITQKRGPILRTFKKSITYTPAAYSGIIFELGSIAFYVASHRAGSVLVPTVIASAAPLVASVMGAVFDKEKISGLKRAGAVVLVTGIILLNVV